MQAKTEQADPQALCFELKGSSTHDRTMPQFLTVPDGVKAAMDDPEGAGGPVVVADPADNATAAYAFDPVGGLCQGRHLAALQRSALRSKLKICMQSARLRHE